MKIQAEPLAAAMIVSQYQRVENRGDEIVVRNIEHSDVGNRIVVKETSIVYDKFGRKRALVSEGMNINIEA